jgi:hypothetical protein
MSNPILDWLEKGDTSRKGNLRTLRTAKPWFREAGAYVNFPALRCPQKSVNCTGSYWLGGTR